MKNGNFVYKIFSLLVLLCCGNTLAWGYSDEVELEGVSLYGRSTASDGDSFRAENACDGDDESYWRCKGSDPSPWIIFRVTDYNNVTQINLYIETPEKRGASITVSSSPSVDEDGEGDWTEIITFNSSESDGTYTISNVKGKLTGQYIKVSYTKSAEKDQVDLNEFTVEGAKPITITTSGITIKHKPAKWYDITKSESISHAADMFDTEHEMLTINGDTKIQNAHTLTDILYIQKGQSVNLQLPDFLNNNVSNETYQRWYNYSNDGLFGDDNILKPTANVDGGYKFENGYVGDPLYESHLYNMTFTYPENGDDEYIVACDVSSYNDFTEEYTSSSKSSEFLSQDESGNWTVWEPTLSHRFIFVIRNAEAYSDEIAETTDITMPATRIPNYTEELVALSRDAQGYGDAKAVLEASIPDEKNTAGIELITTELKGSDRIIHFSYYEENNDETATNADKTIHVTRDINGEDPKATIVVTRYAVNDSGEKTGDGTEVARFNLTFVEDFRLLSQSMVAELNAQKTHPSDGTWRDLKYRTPQSLNTDYQFLADLNFDFDTSIKDAMPTGSEVVSGVYPFPMGWTSSTYGFYDGSSTSGNFDSENAYPQWGYYAFLNNKYMECNFGWKSGKSAPSDTVRENHLGSKSTYHLFSDTSDRPGILARLPFNQSLCRGTELFVTAWVKCARGGEANQKKDNAGMLFTIMGVDEDDNGNVSYTPIYRYQTGQIPTTYRNDENVDLPGFILKNVIGTDGQEVTNTNYDEETNPNEWFQAYFSFTNTADREFDSYAIQVDNNSASTDGGDLYLDDIRVYVATVNPTVTQLEAACTDSPVRVNLAFDWDRLLSRTGGTEVKGETAGNNDAVSFCIVDKEKYEAELNADKDNLSDALTKSVVGLKTSDDVTGDGDKFMTFYYNLNFNSNEAFDATHGDPDASLPQESTDGKMYFYRTGDDNSKTLTTDLYAEVDPNRTYLMVVLTEDVTSINDFADAVTITDENGTIVSGGVCNICSEFTVTPNNIFKVNGAIIEPDLTFCAGQTMNFTAEVRKEQLDPDGHPVYGEDGHIVYEPVNADVYFDWFFGTEDEFTTQQENLAMSLNDALSKFREIYPDAETLSEDMKERLGEDVYNVLEYYYLTEPGKPGGQHEHRLVLHQKSLNITMLDGGLNIVARPIKVSILDDSGNDEVVCWDYIPLSLVVNDEAPSVKPGFNTWKYPELEDGSGDRVELDPCLRIGLRQLRSVSTNETYNSDKLHTLTVSLRDATYATDGGQSLGMRDDYKQLYLVGTDDPAYADFFADAEHFDSESLPIGNLISFSAQQYTSGQTEDNEMTLQFDIDTEKTVDDKTFKFDPKEGYTYNVAVHFEEKDASGAATTACEGLLVLPIKIVPEYVKWNGTATNNWNNDDNWKRVSATEIKKTLGENDAKEFYTDGDVNKRKEGFVPMLFTKVLIPAGKQVRLYRSQSSDGTWKPVDKPEDMEDATQYIGYDLMAYGNEGDDATAFDNIKTQRYRVNLCDRIHFEQGAEMLHSEYLMYNKASVDVSVPANGWTLVSVPLQGVYAGDWYTQESGEQATPYFEDITFNNTDYNRLKPAVFQRSWTGDADVITSSNIEGAPVSFTSAWSSTYNDVSVPYSEGIGFSVNGVLKEASDLLFRFPKGDVSYTYQGGGDVSSSLTRSNPGRLATSKLIDRKPDNTNVTENDDFTVTIKPSNGDYFIIGNPFVSAMDVTEFLTENSDKLEQKYWIYDGSDPMTAGVENEGTNQWLTTGYVLPPYKAFYVKRAGTGTNDITVKFNSDMEVLTTKETADEGAETVANFTIKAANDKGSSMAVVRYGADAVNAYADTEDVVLITDLAGNGSDVPEVYTVADNRAVTINQLKDLQQIPLGVFAAGNDATTLTFTGTAALSEPSLYDAELNTDTPLTEGYTLTVSGPSHGRYFIRAKGAAMSTGITDAETAGGSGVSIYSVVPRQLTVSSSSPLRVVDVYSVGGSLLVRETVADGRTAVTLNNVDSGIAVVRVATADGTVTKKVMVD
mgnify:CR=1 FL=1